MTRLRFLAPVALALAALAGCGALTPGQVTGVHTPPRAATGSGAEVMGEAPEALRIDNWRFDPAKQCPGLPHAPTLAADPLTASSLIRAQSRAPRRYGLADRWRVAPLSPGDVLEVRVVDGEMINGSYVIGLDGAITLPMLAPTPAAGRTLEEVQRQIAADLVAEQIFRPGMARVSVFIRQLGEVSISVGGAVFSPGLISANSYNSDLSNGRIKDAPGDDTWRRRLSGILKAAGGVRPDADLMRVIVQRQGETVEVDMSGVMTGAPLQDPVIATGDYVFVPSRGCFQPELMRISRITPPGMSVFVSNSTGPTYSNSASGLGGDGTPLPYGSRLSQVLVAGNCVGGVSLTEGDRYAVLFGNNPLSGRPEVMSVRIQDVVREPHRLDLNPYMMPGDAVACYDGAYVSMRSVLDIANRALSPLNALKLLLGGL